MNAEQEAADSYGLAENAYIQTAQSDPELTGFYEQSEHALRAIGRALHGAGWLTPAEAEALRSAVPVSPGEATPTPQDRVDVYVRTRNVLRAGMRTEVVADNVMLDWQTDSHGVEHLAGVEVLFARGVEVDGLDVKTDRPHGTAPESGSPVAETPAEPVAGTLAPCGRCRWTHRYISVAHGCPEHDDDDGIAWSSEPAEVVRQEPTARGDV